MTHISSKKLDSKFLEKLFGELIVILGQAHSKDSLSKIAEELFTPTEKIMFAKRLAIILMLASSTPQHKITETLKVSPTTVAKMSFRIEVGKYESVLRISRKNKINIEKLIWGIMTVGGIMPARIGRKYWREYPKKY